VQNEVAELLERDSAFDRGSKPKCMAKSSGMLGGYDGGGAGNCDLIVGDGSNESDSLQDVEALLREGHKLMPVVVLRRPSQETSR